MKAPDVLQTFYLAAESFGYPAKFLSDNAAVFSGKSRRGRVALESELDRLGIQCVHSTPYHPQTCGKVERFHQTLKLFLAKQAPAESIAHLQLQLDAFRTIYNQQRPSATSAGFATFTSATSTDAKRSSCSSPAPRSASSPRTVLCCANSHSTRVATTSAQPALHWSAIR